MNVLVVAFAKNNKLNNNLANVITAANQITSACDVLVIGASDVSIAAQYQGVSRVLHWANIADNNILAVNVASYIADTAKGYTHVLIAADSTGKDILPRVAGILDVTQISEVLKIISPNIFKKPMYAGNIIAEVEVFDEIKLLTIRTISFEPACLGGNAKIEILDVTPVISTDSQRITESLVAKQTVGLADAKYIVSGGRSLGSKESFDELIGGLAKSISAGVGASRAAVEAGYVSNDCQVGQTGKVVAPELYLAIGISGAVQHIAGMKDSKKVIAINTDENAQIFEYADYGLVADLFEVVPQLINKLQ